MASLKFFFDENLPPKIARALAALGVDIVHTRDLSLQGVEDQVWIPQVVDEDRIIVTSDVAIRRRPAEIEALRESGAITFFIHNTFQKQPDPYKQAAWLLHRWDKIEAKARRASKGSAFMVKAGDVEPLVLKKRR